MKYGFIGCGNMGGALARALQKTTKDILICDPSPMARDLALELGCKYGTGDEIGACDRIFLGVKPHMVSGVLAELRPALEQHKPLLISMAAGVSTSQLQEHAGAGVPIIRIMPNTPVMVGKGMILYCANEFVTAEQKQSFLADMAEAGMFDELDEKLIDAASAVSGCGPAYVYLFIEALADGAVACGLPRDKAQRYAAATLAGAAEMVLTTGKHPGALKDAVCSPGGSTIAGVKALENHGFRGAVMDCVADAYTRTLELGK